MASIRFRCPHCGRKIEVDERGAGLEVPCPECAQMIIIPGEPRDVVPNGAPASPLSTVVLRLSAWRIARKYRAVVAGWLCLFAVAAVTRRWPQYSVFCAPLLLASFFLSIVAIQQRRVIHGVLILAFSLTALPLLYQDVFTWVFRAPSPEAVAPSVSVPDVVRKPAESAAARAEAPRLFVDEGERAAMPRPMPVAAAAPARAAAKTVPAPLRVASLARPVISVSPQVMQIPRIVEKITFPFSLYSDCSGIQPFCPSGWMGNINAIDVDDCWEKNPHSGDTCIKCSYTDRGKWAGVAWQDPPNNWGDLPGGFDLTGAKRLSFWARGETGREAVEFKIGLLGVSKMFPDTARATSGKIPLSSQWRQYTIELGGKDLQRIISGFVWVVEGGTAPVTFYLDDIEYE